MAQKNNKPNKLKQFLLGLISKIDNKMKEKSKSSSCSGKPSDGKNKSCCS